jgi:hypothetical protein
MFSLSTFPRNPRNYIVSFCPVPSSLFTFPKSFSKHTPDLLFKMYLPSYLYSLGGPGSSVGIATDYGLDGPGIESLWGRDFPFVQTGPGAHQASCTKCAWSFPGVNYGRGVLLTPHPLLVPRSWKSRAIPLPSLWATTGPVMGTIFLYTLGLPFRRSLGHKERPVR